MAAKPPKPPGVLLKPNAIDKQQTSANSKIKANSNTNNKSEANLNNICNRSATNVENLKTKKNISESSVKQIDGVAINEVQSEVNNDKEDDKGNEELVDGSNESEKENSEAEKVKHNSCNCTNISIMHLFHEMKQKFPTIPDQIVTQYVNDNCHERVKCIELLNNELALNPIPNQAYPSKVIQRPKPTTKALTSGGLSNGSPKSNLYAKASVVGPRLKPIRPAPSTPNSVGKLQLNSLKNSSKSLNNLLDINSNSNSNSNSDNKTHQNINSAEFASEGESEGESSASDILNSNHLNGISDLNTKSHLTKSSTLYRIKSENNINNNCDMPIATAAQQVLKNPIVAFKNNGINSTATIENNSKSNKNNNSQDQNYIVNEKANENHLPRARPTTLQIQTQDQQHRHLKKINLQMHNQQQQQEQNHHLREQNAPQRPLRKAPLPPIPPKPTLYTTTKQQQNITTHQNLLKHQQHLQLQQQQQQQQQQLEAQQLLMLNNKQLQQFANSQQNSFSTDSTSSCVTTPLSPNESEYSVNLTLNSPISLSSPTQSSSLSSSLLPSPTNASITASTSISATNSPLQITQQMQVQKQNENLLILPATNSPQPPATTTIKHRSIITVQPELPYTKDFFISPPITTSSTSANGKSFTSVNLTLRQPISPITNALTANSNNNDGVNGSNGNNETGQSIISPIDISAGPSIKGLTYSSSSYNPRLGYQKNFHITVTGECSYVTASSLRPSRFQANSLSDNADTNYILQQQHLDLEPRIITSTSTSYEQQQEPENINLNNNNNNYKNYGISDSDKLFNHNSVNNNNNNNLNLQNPYKNIIAAAAANNNSISSSQSPTQLQSQQQQHQQYQNVYGDVEKQMHLQKQQQQREQQKQYSNALAEEQEEEEDNTEAMCYKGDEKGLTEKLEKQKERRDALANELRRNRLTKNELEQEINILTEPITGTQLERLDNEIETLRRQCQALTTGPAPSMAPARHLNPHLQGQLSTQSLGNPQTSAFSSPISSSTSASPQPFPRQRPTRSLPHLPTANSSPQSHHNNSSNGNDCYDNGATTGGVPGYLHIKQHHRSTTTSPQHLQQQSPNGSRSHGGGSLTPQQQQQLLLEQFETRKLQQDLLLQQQQQQQLQQQQRQQYEEQVPAQYQSQYPEPPAYSVQGAGYDIGDYEDSSSEGEDDDDEEIQDNWTCSLCTFRNHPQLNVCEACENIRVRPGTFRIIPSNSAASMSSTSNHPSPANAAAHTQAYFAGLNPDSHAHGHVHAHLPGSREMMAESEGVTTPMPSGNLEHESQLTPTPTPSFALPT